MQQSNTNGQPHSSGTSILPLVPSVDLDHIYDDDGLKINAHNRIILMQKLASSANIDLSNSHKSPLSVQPCGTIQQTEPSNLHPLHKLEGLLGPPSSKPTPC